MTTPKVVPKLSTSLVHSPSNNNTSSNRTDIEWTTVNLPITTTQNGDGTPLVVLTGVRLCAGADGRLVVVAVDRNLQAHEHALEDLVVGMEILTIDNTETPLLTVVVSEDDNPLSCTRTLLSGLTVDTTSSTKLVTLIVRKPRLNTSNLITTVLYKPTTDTKTGIGFWQQDPQVDTGHVLIDKIMPSTASQYPLLTPGQRVLSINNQLSFHCKTVAEQVRDAQGLLTLLVQTPQGKVTPKPLYDPVVVTLPLFVFDSYKQNSTNSTNGDLGLILERQYGKVVIAELSKVFQSIKNELKVGMELISINNVTVETPEMAHALLTGAVACATKEGDDKPQTVVTLCAQSMVDPLPGTLITLSVIKPAQDTKLGLVMGMQMPPSINRLPKDYKKQGHVVIRRITPSGLIAKTLAQQSEMGIDDRMQLQPGMILHQISIQNHSVRTKGLHNRELSAFLRTASKGMTISFLAEVPSTTPTTQTTEDPIPHTTLPPHLFKAMDVVAITKKLPGQNIGMTLVKTPGVPQILVQNVEDGGLAAISGVKVGMAILKVNNADVFTVLDVTTGIQQVGAGTPISLLVQTDAVSYIPPVVTGSVYKETTGSKVGIKLRKYKGGSAIVNIREDSISASTDLLGGLMLQSINNVEGEQVNETEKAANMLIDGQGDITMLALTPEVGVMESSPYVTATVLLSKEGKELQEGVFTYKDGKVLVSERGMLGMFAGTALRVGMEVITLNNMDCSLLAKPEGIMAMLETTSDERCVVTVLAKKPILPPSTELVTATVYKESNESKIGLTYVVDNVKKKTVVTRIDDGSLGATTSVLPGMEILTINNAKVQGLDRQGVAKLFAEATGVVTYIGKTHDGRWAKDDRMLIVTVMEKAEMSGPVGVKLIRNQHDNVVIAEIEEGSFAAASDLIPGLVVLAVNNKSCIGKTAREVAGLLDTAMGRVTVLAEASPVGKLTTAALVKATPETKLGVTMVQRNGRVLIKKFVPNSLAEASVLEAGMWIKSINNNDVSQGSIMKAAQLMGQLSPVVTILAEATLEVFDDEEETKDDTKEDEAAAEEKSTEGDDKKEGEQETADEKVEAEAEDKEEIAAEEPEEEQDDFED